MDRTIGGVERGIEIPKRNWGRPGYTREYMSRADLMEVSDSFHISTTSENHRRTQACVLAALRRQRSGKKFTTRTVEGGIRVWRVS